MAAKFASTTHSQISQSEAFLFLGLFDKTNLQIVPKKGLLICTSNLQLLFVRYKLKLQVITSIWHYNLQVHLRVELQVILQVQFQVFL